MADRTSAATMRANQLRLWLASMAYVLVCALHRIGLAHTRFAQASCGTIRLKLLKIGAVVRISVRRIKIAMASGCPYQDDFTLACARLRRAAATSYETHTAQPPCLQYNVADQVARVPHGRWLPPRSGITPCVQG